MTARKWVLLIAAAAILVAAIFAYKRQATGTSLPALSTALPGAIS